MPDGSARAFEGVRVIDFSQVFAGPYAGALLAMQGADVIKIERPEGDDARNMFPVDLPDGTRNSTFYMTGNINKRSVVLDLKRPAGVDAAKRLLADADVLIENFRPGVMARFGLGYEDVAAINPGIVYCSMTGFGQEGPERDSPAYDGRIQAASGVMSITGHKDRGPTRCGFAVVDAATGMTGAFAIASALFQRKASGRGQYIDVAMLDTFMSFMSPTIAQYTIGGSVPEQSGNMAASLRPTADMFPVKEGFILLACNSERQFVNLVTEVGRKDLLDDPRFVDWPTREKNGAALRTELIEAFAGADAATWEERLNKAGVPSSRILTIPEVVAHRQVEFRKLMVPFEDYSLVGAPFRYAHGGPSLDTVGPALGAHTAEVLGGAGLDADAIREATGG